MATVIKLPSQPGGDKGKKDKPSGRQSPGGKPGVPASLQGQVQPRHYFMLGGALLVVVLVVTLIMTAGRMGSQATDSDKTEVNVSSPETQVEVPTGPRVDRSAGTPGDAIPQPDPDH